MAELLLTPEDARRLDVLYHLVRAMPLVARLSFARSLLHDALLDLGPGGERAIDLGMFDTVAKEEFYAVAASGPLAEVLRMQVAGLVRSRAMADRCRTVCEGSQATSGPTPLGTPAAKQEGGGS